MSPLATVALVLGISFVGGLQGFSVGYGYQGLSRHEAACRGLGHAAVALVIFGGLALVRGG